MGIKLMSASFEHGQKLKLHGNHYITLFVGAFALDARCEWFDLQKNVCILRCTDGIIKAHIRLCSAVKRADDAINTSV